MEKEFLERISQTVSKITQELIEKSHLSKNTVVVVGCSTSEVRGSTIGTASNEDIANAILTLSSFPEKYRVMRPETERLREIRRMVVDNYSVFYLIRGDRIIVTNVLYSASDIETRLLEE